MGKAVDGTAHSVLPAAPSPPPGAYHRLVRRFLQRFLTAAQLTRFTLAYGAIADVWLVLLLSRADPAYNDLPVDSMPIVLAMAAALAVAVGLFAFGASLNDVLDARHDRTFSPDRPIPAGRIRPQQAVVVVSVCLAFATFAASAFGVSGVAITTFTALGIVFYNLVGRYVPSIGFVTIGLVHATHMAIPNYHFMFTLPIWLSMTHATTIAILVHRLEDKRPAATLRDYLATAAGWLTWSFIILGWGYWQAGGAWPMGHDPWPGLIWPMVAVAAFVLVARIKTVGQPGPVASEKLRRYGAMWQSLYAVTWFGALGLWKQAAILGGVAAGGFLAMTAFKEITILMAAPVGWRED